MLAKMGKRMRGGGEEGMATGTAPMAGGRRHRSSGRGTRRRKHRKSIFHF
jgi:hypothetical protein